MNFEVGKKYTYQTFSKGIYVTCKHVTSTGNGLAEYPNGNACVMHKDSFMEWSEYVEPPLVVGDMVSYKEFARYKYTILAIDGETVWAKCKSGGYTQQHISSFERVK